MRISWSLRRQWMLDTVCEHYPGHFNGCVIYNGRSPSLFRPSAEKQNCVLAVGRIWDEAKHIEATACPQAAGSGHSRRRGGASGQIT